jgi:hypothetical protein
MRFDYGDTVLVCWAVEIQSPRGDSVVGVRPVESEEQAVLFGFPVGTTLYTVEFADGSDALIPESSLTPSDDQ